MKRCLLLFTFFVIIASVYAQNNQWTWMGGENNYTSINYGIKTVADSANTPGVRSGAASWKDASGNFWLFGGGDRNDLWKFDPVIKSWTWMNGDMGASQQAVYGTRRIASPANKPGAWNNAITWTDSSGNFWMYSNVLWKYYPSVNQWAWVNGDTAVTQAVYGIKGIADAANKPGTVNSVGWMDVSGNLWLYGNVLWKYDLDTDLWTWVNGDTVSTKTVYGLKGIPNSTNTPGTRSEVTGWTDASGKFWLFGGTGTVSTPYTFRFINYYTGDLNDLWRYDAQTNEWTWVSGDTVLYAGGSGAVGTTSPNNRPGARSDAVSWTDTSGNLWLFGGFTYTSFSLPRYNPRNDLWKYDPATNLWTCLNAYTFRAQDTFDVKGMESPKTKPAMRFGAVGWTEASGSLWLFGGITYEFSMNAWRLNDLLRFNPVTSMWSLERENKDGRVYGFYGTQGVASAANTPGGRYNAASCTDSTGNLWLFGGHGYKSSGEYYDDLNDFWKRDTANQWMWLSGSATPASFPGSNVPNIPGPSARYDAMTWKGANNRIWLFGGSSIAQTYYNDLWNFSQATGEWTLVSENSAGKYGIKGQPAPDSKPGRRSNAATWTDRSGRFWFFGGSTGFLGPLDRENNDVWNYDPAINQWTWVSGDSTSGQPGVYGSMGITDAASRPGARQGAAGWSDSAGNVWIFGGVNLNGNSTVNANIFLNDLWKYNTQTNLWTWVSGDSSVNRQGVYGIKGVPDAANKPGGRYDAVSWMDATGRLWLFGGVPVGGSGFLGNSAMFLNDLWNYNPATSLWTWVSGDSTANAAGSYGSRGTANSINKPGARTGAIGWKDNAGNFWLMGGIGLGWRGSGFLNDVWKFSPASPALPVTFHHFSAAPQNSRVMLSWTTGDEQHSAYYAIQRSHNGIRFDSIGTVSATNGNRYSMNNYRFTDHEPLQEVNYYRLKQVDIDGKYTYSSIKKVVFGYAGFTLTMLQNPVADELKINLQSDKVARLQLMVRNAAGHLLVSETQQLNRGSSNHIIPVKGLSAGTYFITVFSGKASVTRKFMKL